MSTRVTLIKSAFSRFLMHSLLIFSILALGEIVMRMKSPLKELTAFGASFGFFIGLGILLLTVLALFLGVYFV